jgi:hypothetical protein
MAEGNGADVGSMAAVLGQVLRNVEKLSVDMGQLKSDLGQFKSETKRDFSRVHADIAVLRQEVAQYHGSVAGHGMLITEVQARLSRIEEHLNLPPFEAH